MKTKISTSLKLVIVLFLNILLFAQMKAQCVANWYSTGGTTYCSAYFSNASTGTNPNTTYEWNFGDGQTSSVQNPGSHTYAGSGTYNVCLYITVPNGTNYPCRDTLCKPVTVNCPNTTPCIANWSYQAATYSCSVSFFDNSTGATSWSWDFGDGQTSNQQNPIHYYSASGTYSVCLTITASTPNGTCTNTLCKTVTVTCPTTTPCNANWTVQTGTVSCTAYFTNTSTGTNPNTSYSWSFGDGQTSNQQNPVHSYSSSGTYNVCLVISVNNGNNSFCKDTLCKTVTVYCPNTTPCAANWQWQSTTGSCTVYFFDNSTGATSWSWDFNGQTSTQQNPVHTYSASGTYTVCLTITGTTPNGPCTNTLCKTITVYCSGTTPCNANWTVQTGTVSCTAYFTNTSTGTNSTTLYYWDFGDGQTSNLPNPAHTYSAAGTYNVCLIITVPNGTNYPCKDTLCKTVTVSCPNTTPCAAKWQWQSTTGSCTVYFFDNSTGATSWNWNFGDGQTSTQQSPVHTYTASGTYSVCLTITVTTPNGTCTDMLCKTVTVYCNASTPCVANWNFQTGTSSCTVYFNDYSVGANAWSWNFGDGQTSNQQNPVHTYSASGTYNVCLIISVPNGTNYPCKDTLCKLITVTCQTTTPCTVNWQWQSTTASCTAYFFDYSSGATAWSWNFGDGQTSNLQNPVHSYSVSGTYSVCLTITAATPTGNCTNTLCKTITVYCPNTAISSLDMPNFWLSVNNPVFSSANVQYSLPFSGRMELVLFDLVGNKINVLETGSKSTGIHSYLLSTANFSKGVYFIYLSFEGTIVTKKIIMAE